MAGTDSTPQVTIAPQDAAKPLGDAKSTGHGLLSAWQRLEEPASFIEDDEDFSIPPSPLEIETKARLSAGTAPNTGGQA